MNNNIGKYFLILFFSFSGVFLLSFYNKGANNLQLPYEKAGWTQKEAAAHLLSRFSFGATPGQVDGVVKAGIENWMEEQLNGKLPDGHIDEVLSRFETLKMSNSQIVQTYPKGGQVLKMAINDGIINRDSAKIDKKDSKKVIKDYMVEKGLKPQGELLRQLVSQKILRAAYSNNQLSEVMTDFWFNHFNVAVAKGGVAQFVISYERDAIRPNVLGKFQNLLLATAKSPAMLTYLDNNKSSVNEDNRMQGQQMLMQKRGQILESMQKNANSKIKKPRMKGLNENYAREIMELHTLGVDAGYTQSDVTQAARVLTGWSLNPQIEYNIKASKPINEQRLQKLGFVLETDFLFAANKHDKAAKVVLGETFPSDGGYEEGVRLIHILATHPATAQFISKKLAVRFVSDNPPKSLVDKMAKTFLQKDGDIKEVLKTMISAPEFWNKETIRAKTKSPFELAISSVRSTGAAIDAPYLLYQWINKMGQQLYNYQAPTGFPDKGQYWINTGSLLNRMNFGLALASGRIPGVKMNLLALNNNHEPESAEEALKIYSTLLLSERNVDATIKRLSPMLNDQELVKKVDAAANQTPMAQTAMKNEDMDMMTNKNAKGLENARPSKKIYGEKGNIQMLAGNNTMLAQVVGIIIGSPEFQRR